MRTRGPPVGLPGGLLEGRHWGGVKELFRETASHTDRQIIAKVDKLPLTSSCDHLAQGPDGCPGRGLGSK